MKDKTYYTPGLMMMVMGVFALSIVAYFEHVLKLAPCEICLLERWPWRIIIVCGACTLCSPKRYRKYGIVAGILCLFASMGLSTLHIGVEHKWWPSPFASCKAPVLHSGMNFKDWMASMPVRPNKPCDAPDFVFGLPFSITELGGIYAVVSFVALVVISLTSKRKSA